MKETINFVRDNYDNILIILTAIYEILVRKFPTSKNLSILDNAVKLFSFFAPNRSTEKTVLRDKNGFLIKETNKHILTIAFLFVFSTLSFSQLNYNGKSYNSYNADSTTVRYNTGQLQTAYGQVGTIYYNKQSYKWRVYQDSVWYDLVNTTGGGGSASLTNTYVGFGDNTNHLTGTSNLTFNNSNKLLSIGTTQIYSPSSQNLFIGQNAGNLTANVNGHNIAIGDSASYQIGSNVVESIAIGYFNSTANTSNRFNVAIGNHALEFNTGGEDNVAIGHKADWHETNGGHNVAIGVRAMDGNNQGNSNVAIGVLALGNIYNGFSNTAIGYHSMDLGSNMSLNTAIGNNTLENLSNARFNVALGNYSINASTSGERNTALGYATLFQNVSGEQNTCVGFQAGYSALGSRNVFIGHFAGGNETGSDKLYIANDNTSTPLIGGDFASKTVTINGKETVTPTSTLAGLNLGTISSDPSSLSDGDIWQNSASSTIKGRVGGSTVTIYPQGNAAAGSNTQIQFNNSGAFGASASLLWDGAAININSSLYSSTSLQSIGNYQVTPVTISSASSGYNMSLAAGANSGAGNGGNFAIQSGSANGGGTPGNISMTIQNDAATITRPSIGTLTITGSNTSTSTGENITIVAGSPSTGNNNGGTITLTPGTQSGSGTAGDIIINITRTSCAGAPSKSLAIVAGVLTICP